MNSQMTTLASSSRGRYEKGHLYRHMRDKDQTMDSQRTLQTLPSRVNYGVYFISILEKHYRVISRFDCNLIWPAGADYWGFPQSLEGVT